MSLSEDQLDVEDGLKKLSVIDEPHSQSDNAECALPPSQSNATECCKSKECLKTISLTIKESCHQQAKAQGRVLYVSRYIYPHIEGPPDTKQSFIYKVPDEHGQEMVVCQKAFKRVFGISQYNLQQAQGAAIKRTKGKDKEIKDGDATGDVTDARSPQPKKSAGFFRRLSRSFSKRLHSRNSPSKTKIEQEKEEAVEIQHIEYDLRRVKITKESQILGQFNQINNTQTRQTATWKTSQTRTTTRTYEWHWGDESSISTDAEFTIGLPVIAEGEVGISDETTISIGNKQGVVNAETDSWEFDLPGTVEAMRELTIKLVAEKGRVSIPVVATLRRHGKIWKEDGMYVGTQCLNAKVIYE